MQQLFVTGNKGLISGFYPFLLEHDGVVVNASDFRVDDRRVGVLRIGWHVSLLCCVLRQETLLHIVSLPSVSPH